MANGVLRSVDATFTPQIPCPVDGSDPGLTAS